MKKYITIYQPGHTLIKDDPIYIDTNSNQFVKSHMGDLSYTLGIVTTTGVPTYDHFTFNAFGEFRDSYDLNLGIEQTIVGKIFYIDPTGISQYTTIKPAQYPYPVYQIINTNGDAILIKGTRLTINGSSESISSFDLLQTSSLQVNNIQGFYAADIITFNNRFYAPIATVSTLNVDGIYLTGDDSINSSLLYADSSLTLHWNGKSILTDFTSSFEILDTSSLKVSSITGFLDTILFNSKFYASDATVSSLHVNGLYLTGAESTKTLPPTSPISD